LKAIIPVAGKGKRLYPHTRIVPKALLPTAGKPVLSHIFDRLLNSEIKKICLIIGEFSKEIEAFCLNYGKFEFEFVTQGEALGLGHAIYQALDSSDDPCLIMLGDTIINLDYVKLLNSKYNSIGVAKVNDPKRYGIVELNGERIIKFWEKPENPPSDLAILGIYLIKNQSNLRTAINYLFDNDIKTKNEYQLTDALSRMLNLGEVFNKFNIDEYLDCGIPETLLSTNRVLLEKKLGNSISSTSKIIASDIKLSTISDGCTVINSELHNVIMLSGSRVENTHLRDVIVGCNEKIL
tara:strand:+ start:88 stop:969 length:882 start_codon:yes stop_codon:yes gene_type:complete